MDIYAKTVIAFTSFSPRNCTLLTRRSEEEVKKKIIAVSEKLERSKELLVIVTATGSFVSH